MKASSFIVIVFITNSLFAQQKWDYPETPKVPVYDTIWGKVVQDDYRWMENMNDTSVTHWLHAQTDFTNSWINKLKNIPVLESEFKSVINEEGITYYPWLAGFSGTVFHVGDGNWKTPRMYFLRKNATEPELIIDPGSFEEGKVFEFNGAPIFSPNEKYIAVNLQESGSTTSMCKIWDVAHGKFLPENFNYDRLRFTNKDDEILYDESFTTDVKSQDYYKYWKTFVHTLGNPRDADMEMMNHTKYPELLADTGFSPGIRFANNSPYLLANKPFTKSIYIEIFTAPAGDYKNVHINWKPLTTAADEITSNGYILSGNKAFFIATKNEPGFAVRMTELPEGNFSNSELLFRPDPGWLIESVKATKNFLPIKISKNGVESKIYSYHIATGKLQETDIKMKGDYTIAGVHPTIDLVNIIVNGWAIKEGSYFTYDLNNNQLIAGVKSKEKTNSIDSNLVVEEIEYPSHDGVMVPLTIIYDKRYFKKGGLNGVELRAYGAYGIKTSPYYVGFLAPLFKRGYAYSVAHVRGGGVKGKEWHMAGQKGTKPNTWKDFIAAAEYLIENKYTTPQKLCITGGSAGGITVGRALTERPGLFAVAIPEVGLMNPMRGEFSGNPIGTRSEFGSIMHSRGEAEWLYEMDAMHHTKAGVKYPAQFITSGYIDPRITVWIPGKYAAKMQHSNSSERPQFLHVDFNSGHYGGATLDDQIRMTAVKLAFQLWQTGHPDFQPNN